ncbi:MAG TPA: fibronectin type III domain-containing protein [Patescibacteria group bacterium]|nr:fibronectin type III domain-containing protein [Patescibacteria group bacterium]
MRKKAIYLTILISIALTGASPTQAEISFSNVYVYAIRNGTAKISWDTFEEPTKAYIYYGKSADKLDKSLEYGVYDYNHETTLSGLERDVTYYYKITAVNRANESKELFLQTFSTKDMPDTLAPQFVSATVLQSTKDAIALEWETNEETKAEIKFGTDPNNLNRGSGDGDFRIRHEKIIGDLDTDQKYYFKIIAEDRDQNKTDTTIQFRTGTSLSNKTELVIDNIRPIDADPTRVFTTGVNLSWRTNMIAKCKIRYGLKSGDYNKELEANNKERVVEHSISLTGLEPATVYYYKLECYESFYDKRKETTEYTFRTFSPNEAAKATAKATDTQNASVTIAAELKDTDGDTLSDGYEKEIYTNPNKKDTDGDGYNDDVELKYGYDPLIAGSAKLQAALYYRPKLTTSQETAKGNELKNLIRQKMGVVKISDKNWQTLIRAYIYGHYPVEAITKAIQLGGVTVHPTIPWESWQKTEQYRNAMGI